MALSLLQLKARFQDPLRQGIVDLLWESSRVMRRLNFIQQPGLSYPYQQRSKLPGIAFRGLNEDYTPGAGVVNPAIERLAILGGSIKTDHIAIDTKGDGARTNEIAAKMEAAGKFFDKNFFNGDMTQNVKGFDGLKRRLTGTKLVTQATNGGVVTAKKVIQLQDLVEGPNAEKVLFMNQTNRRNLVDAITSSTSTGVQRLLEFNAANGNYRFNGSEIEEVFFDETETAILDFNETTGSSNATSSIYCVKFGGAVDERGVQGLSGLREDIKHRGPIIHGTFIEDVVEMASGIGIFSGHAAARLEGTLAA